MARLTAFADEISGDLREQIAVLRRHGIRHLELRFVGETNVVKLSPEQRREVKRTLDGEGMSVSTIASPVGKVKIDEPWEPHLDVLRHALALADEFGTRYVRVFSYYPPAGGAIADHRAEVMRRMKLKADLAHAAGKVLVHENEKDIYGSRPEACREIVAAVNSPGLRAVFDPANFVEMGEDATACWRVLRPYVEYFHIKDVLRGTHTMVPAGRGDGRIPVILADAARRGWDHFLVLEPHLAAGGQFSGFTGPDLFGTAVEALCNVCGSAGIRLE
jgi:sugar phosphate isomerase/epimerase